MADQTEVPARTWEVLLLGGPSGVGKTAISYRLARHFDIAITEVDDFQVLLERMTTPEQQPALHWSRTQPDFDQLPATEIMEEGLLAVGHVMAVGLEAVIAHRLEAHTPVILEGDFIHPELAARTTFGAEPNGGRVRAVFLYEEDEQQLLANFLQREPAAGPQGKRARVSWLHGQWLRQEAGRLGLPALLARPWDTVLERVIAAVS